MKFNSGEIPSMDSDAYWRTAVFEVDPVSSYVESSVAVNALMQFSRDRVSEVSNSNATKVIAELWQDSSIESVKQIRDSQKQDGSAEVHLTYQQGVLISAALAHYSSRTKDEVSFMKGVSVLDQTNTRIIEGGIASMLLTAFLDESEKLQSEVDITIAQYFKPAFGFISALNT